MDFGPDPRHGNATPIPLQVRDRSWVTSSTPAAAVCSSSCARSERARAMAISAPIFTTSRSAGLSRARPRPVRCTSPSINRRASAFVSPSVSLTDSSTDQLTLTLPGGTRKAADLAGQTHTATVVFAAGPACLTAPRQGLTAVNAGHYAPIAAPMTMSPFIA